MTVLGRSGFPRLDSDPEKLRPERRQPSMELYKSVMEKLGGDQRTLTVMASGDSVDSLHEVFENGAPILESDPAVASATLPVALWPNESHQAANQPHVEALLGLEARLLEVAEEEGFVDEALTLTKRAFAAWRSFSSTEGLIEAQDASSRWLLDRVMAVDLANPLALGFVKMREGAFTMGTETVTQLNAIGLRPIGWEFLTPAIGEVLRHDIRHVVVPTVGILLILLAVVFRSIKGVCLSVALLGFGVLWLMAIMKLRGTDWNIVNLAAGPLLLGLGLDYSIHVILALRRTRGNVALVRQNIGRALLLCGTTTAVGFASLKSARHGGLPNLGELCAIGILVTMVTAIVLVPHWWRAVHRDILHDRDEELPER